MTNYQNEIMDLLKGDTPKEKYDYLKGILDAVNPKKYELDFFKSLPKECVNQYRSPDVGGCRNMNCCQLCIVKPTNTTEA